MSALGQKRSFLPGPPNVRFAPKADIPRALSALSVKVDIGNGDCSVYRQRSLEACQWEACWDMSPRFQGPHHHSENDPHSGPSRAQLRLVEPSKNQIAVLSSLGQDLRKARQAKGLEIPQISSSLKISKRHLTAIKESDVEALPLGDVYLIGYTRTYANYLGLNTGQCLEKLKSEIAERAAKGPVPLAQRQAHDQKSSSVVRRTLRFLGLGSYDL